MTECCELCERHVPKLHKHHLIPRILWKRLRRRRQTEGNPPIARLCLLCSRQVHALFNEHELANIGTIGELKKQPAIQEYITWVRKYGLASYTSPPKLSNRVKEGLI